MIALLKLGAPYDLGFKNIDKQVVCHTVALPGESPAMKVFQTFDLLQPTSFRDLKSEKPP